MSQVNKMKRIIDKICKLEKEIVELDNEIEKKMRDLFGQRQIHSNQINAAREAVV